TNAASGDIRVINNKNAPGALNITGISNTGGSVRVENFGTETLGITVSGPISAAGTVTLISHSPLKSEKGADITSAAGVDLQASGDVKVQGKVSTTGGDVTLEALTGSVTVEAAVSATGGDVSLDAGTNLTVSAPVSTTGGGAVSLTADEKLKIDAGT